MSTKASLIPSLPPPSLTQQLHTPRKKSILIPILIGLISNLGGSASLPLRPPSGDSPPPTWSSAGSREQGARAATPRDAAKALRQRTAPASSDHASPLHPTSAHGSWEHRPLLHATLPRRRRPSKSAARSTVVDPTRRGTLLVLSANVADYIGCVLRTCY